MSGFPPNVNRRGNYCCPYCTHASWKRRSAAVTHIHNYHAKEALEADNKELVASKNREIERLKERLAEAQKPPIKKEEKKYYDAAWYCTNCENVGKGGMPVGVMVNHVTCGTCGCQTLHLIRNMHNVI